MTTKSSVRPTRKRVPKLSPADTALAEPPTPVGTIATAASALPTEPVLAVPETPVVVAVPLPALTTVLHRPWTIVFQGLGETTSMSGYTIAKNLAMAFAELSRGNATSTGVTSNILEAFELISYDPTTFRLEARLKGNAETMTTPVGDPKYMADVEQRVRQEAVTQQEAIRRSNSSYSRPSWQRAETRDVPWWERRSDDY